MLDDMGGSVHEFYSYKGSTALAEKLKTWPGGKLVIHITEMPIKCPVAPLEFAFLADAFFKDKGMRDKVELTYVTPLDAAFTKPIAAEAFGNTLEEKGITVVPDFMIESVDAENKKIVAFDETEVPFDLLVTIPLNMGADYVGAFGPRQRPQPGARGQVHPAGQGATPTSSRWATPTTSPPRRPGRWRTSRSTSSSTTSCSSSRAGR